MKSLVKATIAAAVSALSLADGHALGWALVALVALFAVVVVTAVFSSRFKTDAQEVLRLLLGRPSG
jgi:hypothetical protein